MEDVGDGVVEDARMVVGDAGDAMCEANQEVFQPGGVGDIKVVSYRGRGVGCVDIAG